MIEENKYRLTCDVCGKRLLIRADSRTEAYRQALAEHGWHFNPVWDISDTTTPQDHCPDCKPKGKKKGAKA